MWINEVIVKHQSLIEFEFFHILASLKTRHGSNQVVFPARFDFNWGSYKKVFRFHQPLFIEECEPIINWNLFRFNIKFKFMIWSSYPVFVNLTKCDNMFQDIIFNCFNYVFFLSFDYSSHILCVSFTSVSNVVLIDNLSIFVDWIKFKRIFIFF